MTGALLRPKGMTFVFHLSFLKVKSLATLHLLAKIGIGQEVLLAMLYNFQQSPHTYEVFQGVHLHNR